MRSTKRKRSSTKRKRSSSKRKRSSKQSGRGLIYGFAGHIVKSYMQPQQLNVLYNKIPLTNGQDLTGQPEIYTEVPEINISPFNDNLPYLVTLTDPDAPAGIWAHYAVLIKKKGTILKTFFQYQPPNPPPNTGIHRYIFQAYPLKFEAPASDNHSEINKKDGHLYYKQELEPLIKNLQAQATLQFTVKA